ncbi:signal peptidase I [Buchnera aphidicola (Ceratovacuna keduensis)]|uniref:signal peptidase I n=1 Tax=Buchnera aphidicola TaxID=9 RepID=UPI0031B7FA88
MYNLITNIIIFFTFITFIFWIYEKFIINFLNKNYFFKKNNIITFISSFFYTFLIIFLIKSFFYESFRIKSNSMFPTLIDGDFVIVEKFSYGIKDPIFNKTIINYEKPQNGDVVIFKYPKNENIFFIKRIAAIPGDIIKYNVLENKIYIYRKYIKKNKIYIKKISSFNNIKNFNCKNEVKKYNYYSYKIFSIKKNIFFFKKFIENKKNNLHIFFVPKNNYFVLGDNLKNSLDSRFWGFVPEKNFIGKVKIIWMSIDNSNNRYLGNIIFKRIGILL